MTNKLREALTSVTAGRIERPELAREIGLVLEQCWDGLKGAKETSMEAWKLSGRIEDLDWDPPLLSFTIERHGRTVNASSRADLHRWTVDVEKGEASWNPAGHRQLTPMAKRFKAAPVAEEIVRLILEGVDCDPRLEWISRSEVHVDIANIVPDGGSNQTTAERRKLFRKECEDRLKAQGWNMIKCNRYRKSAEA